MCFFLNQSFLQVNYNPQLTETAELISTENLTVFASTVPDPGPDIVRYVPVRCRHFLPHFFSSRPFPDISVQLGLSPSSHFSIPAHRIPAQTQPDDGLGGRPHSHLQLSGIFPGLPCAGCPR